MRLRRDHARGARLHHRSDQTALYQRVKQIGTVKEFMDWFDVMRKRFTATA